MRVIGLSGRKHSGKTELAQVLVENGYQVINFADHLKNLVRTMIGCSLDDLNKYKETVSEYDLSEHTKYISLETDIPEEEIIPYFEKPFRTIREILQVLGTNIIREFNPNWHIFKTKLSMIEGQKYALADVRFPNEKTMIESMGGEVYFIIRPDNMNISNHLSEVSLRRNDFKSTNIIMNNSSKQNLINRWKKMFQSSLVIETKAEINLFYDANSISAYAIGLMMGKGETNKIFTDPFIVEDLKYWNILDKQVYSKPDILDFHLPMVRYWLLGIVDTQSVEINKMFIEIKFKNENLKNLFVDNITFNINSSKTNTISIPINTFTNWLSRDVNFGKDRMWKRLFLSTFNS